MVRSIFVRSAAGAWAAQVNTTAKSISERGSDIASNSSFNYGSVDCYRCHVPVLPIGNRKRDPGFAWPNIIRDSHGALQSTASSAVWFERHLQDHRLFSCLRIWEFNL